MGRPPVNKRRRPTNDHGRVIGEAHHRAKLSDADIELIHWLSEQGLTYGQIARKFDDGVSVSRSMVRRICIGERRGQLAKGTK